MENGFCEFWHLMQSLNQAEIIDFIYLFSFSENFLIVHIYYYGLVQQPCLYFTAGKCLNGSRTQIIFVRNNAKLCRTVWNCLKLCWTAWNSYELVKFRVGQEASRIHLQITQYWSSQLKTSALSLISSYPTSDTRKIILFLVPRR